MQRVRRGPILKRAHNDHRINESVSFSRLLDPTDRKATGYCRQIRTGWLDKCLMAVVIAELAASQEEPKRHNPSIALKIPISLETAL